MSLIINHNLSALNTHRNLSVSGNSMSKSIEKLSSGYKINVGADDPSGLIISEQLRSQISGLERAVRNSSEAFNLIGIAEGALNEMNTILKKMRALAIHAANSGVTSPEQVSADQAEMDSGIETLNRIANTTRYSDQYLLNGSKQLVYDVNTVVDEPTDHALLDTKMTRIDQVFKRDGVKMSIGFSGEKSKYQANTDTSAQRAYLESDAANSLCEISGASVTAKQEFILTGTSGSRMFSFAAGTHVGTIVDAINNVKDSTGIGATMTFASDVRIDQTTTGTADGQGPDYKTNTPATAIEGYDDGTYVYSKGDIQIYNAGLNDPATSKINSVCITPDAAESFKVGYNCDGDGKIYAKVIDKSTGAIEYYKDKDCTMLIGKGDGEYFAATNNSGIPSSPTQNLDGIFIDLNVDNAQNLDVFEIGVVGQRLDNMKDMNVTGLQGWCDVDNSVMSGVNLGVNTSPEGDVFFRYTPVQFEADGVTVKTFKVEAFSDSSMEPKYLVASSGEVSNNMNIADPVTGQLAGQTVRVESVVMDSGKESGLNITLNLPQKGALDHATGMSLDELKQTQLYQDLEADVTAAQAAFDAAEADVNYVAGETAYNMAKNNLENAKTDLKNAEDALKAAEKDLLEKQKIQTTKDAARDAYVDSTLKPALTTEFANLKTTAGAYKTAYDALVSGGVSTVDADKLVTESLAKVADYLKNGGDPTAVALLTAAANDVKAVGGTYDGFTAPQKTLADTLLGQIATELLSPTLAMLNYQGSSAYNDANLADINANAAQTALTTAQANVLTEQGDLATAQIAFNTAESTFNALPEKAVYDAASKALEDAKADLAAYVSSVGTANSFMPKIEQTGNISFTNLGMRIYALEYGSAETIRIQNKAGNLFYQYRESDSMEKVMVKPDTTVQVSGQDAQIALNGAPVYTTGLIANTTTPDFSGALVFNSGTLGLTTLAVAGYEDGRLFSKSTALQGVEENEARISELNRYFEPPAFTVPMGDYDTNTGLLDKNGKPVNLYVDFSQIDPTVEVKIDNLGALADIEMSYDMTTNRLTISAQDLATDPANILSITIPVNPENLKGGGYVTDPALKGLYIKTDVLVDSKKTSQGGDFDAETQEMTAYNGSTLLEVNTYATNPRSNTTESMSNFIGGMQFQLGNTEGDQDRTVYSIQSMSMSELGRISYEGVEYCLQNVLGGGEASLSKDPILAMRILAQAVDDVSTLRARLGAFQSNMLQTNINSLNVAIENITKTESAIRDTDMAAESTDFTRFQIMQQAGTSMLAQANQVSQNVLSLLQ